MKRTHVLAATLLLATAGFAQQTPSPTSPQDRTTTNPGYQAQQTYDRARDTGRGFGNWGLFGLLGLAGLLGRRGGATSTYTRDMRDDRTYGEQQRRVG